MALICWKLALSMHVKRLSKLTKLHVCGKLLNQIVLLKDKKRGKETFEACEKKKKKPLSSRRKPQSACAVTSGYPDAPSTRLQRAPGHPDDPPLKSRILLRPRMRRIQAYLRKSSNHACLVTIESVCASPILFGEERLRQILRRRGGRGRSIATESQENSLEWWKADHNTASNDIPRQFHATKLSFSPPWERRTPWERRKARQIAHQISLE